MGSNISPLAQEDIRQVLDRALDVEKGVKIIFSSGTLKANNASAVFTRARMHKFRASDRKRNREVYVADHPLHGTSIWDGIIISKVELENGAVELRLTKSDITKFQVEDLI